MTTTQHRYESTWPDGTTCGAIFSEDERHRFLLWRLFPRLRLFDAPIPRLPLFLMLNPSTATHEVSDPTVTRCAGFAKRLGYHGFQVCNLFSFRSTDPKALSAERNAEGDPSNLSMILSAAGGAEIVICSWGVMGEIRQRRVTVIRALREAGLGDKLRCLGRTQDGSPCHPLYLASATELEPYLGLDFYAEQVGA
jgi:hypothetical protein